MGKLFHMVMETILNVLAGNQVYSTLVELSYAIPSVSNLLVTIFVYLCGEKKEIRDPEEYYWQILGL